MPSFLDETPDATTEPSMFAKGRRPAPQDWVLA